MHNKIASLRKAWALSQAELGEIIGKSGSTVSSMEQGARQYSLDVALRLSALFDTGIVDMFPDHTRQAIEAVAAKLAPLSIRLNAQDGLAAERKRDLLTKFSGRFAFADSDA